jgi:FSR family fosmidomycin resistance protein-like MFS transporter
LPHGLLASLLLVDLADEWFTFLPAGAMESIRADLGLSYAQAGLLLALLPAGGVLGTVLMAAADFVSRRLLGAGGALVFALCLLVFATSRTFVALAVASFVWGAASDAFVHSTQLALAELAGDELDAMLARTNLLGSLGELLGPLTLAGAAGVGLGWRPVFSAGGVLMLAYAAWLAAQRLPPPRPHGTTPWSVVRAVVRDGRVLRLAAIWTLIGALEAPFFGFLIANLEETRYVSTAAATAILVCVVAGGVATYAALAAASRPFSARSRFVVASLGLLVTTMVMVSAPSPVVVGAAGVGFGAASAVLWVALQAATYRLRPGQVGTTQAAVSGLSTVGIAVPTLIGVAADRLGVGAAMWLFVLAPAGILSLAITSRADERRQAVRA